MSVEINNASWYEISYLKLKYPKYFTGCHSTPVKILVKKNIPTDQYIYTSFSEKTGWTVLDNDSIYSRKKLYISKQWCDVNIQNVHVKAAIFNANRVNTPIANYNPLPILLELEEREKFKDDDGNVIDIQIRGERTADCIFFKSTDIGKMLDIENVRTTIVHPTSTFEEHIHYEYFINDDSSTAPVFLTYYGLIKLIFSSKKTNAIHYQRWAMNILFVVQMGSVEDKQKLAADILRVDCKSIKSFMSTCVTPVPCVYLFNLGKVKELREIFDIPSTFGDDENVVKYGFTKNLKRRSAEHEKTYGAMVSDLVLKYHVYIDDANLSNAERDVMIFFTDCNMMLKHKKFNEIACVSDDCLNGEVQRIYTDIGYEYGEKIRDVQKELDYANKLNAQMAEHHEKMLERADLLNRQMREHHEMIDAKNEKLLEASLREIELYRRLLDR